MVLVGILLSVVDGSLDASSVLSVYLYLQFINTFSGLNAGDIATTVIGFFMNNLLVVTLSCICMSFNLQAKNSCEGFLLNTRVLGINIRE